VPAGAFGYFTIAASIMSLSTPPSEDARAAQAAAVEQHLQEARVVHRGADHAAATEVIGLLIE
jgi:hypothetical protein